MPNPIKYTTGSETNALKKGNFYIGTGSEGKGPSDVTGYYNGVTPQTGGYVIYMFKDGAPGNLSYHSAANDSELISFTSGLAGQTYTGVSQCFDYYAGQTDKVMIIQEFPSDYPLNYPNIVMPGLVLNLDAGITQSYPGSGTTWSDINGLGPNNNGTLTNGPTFSSDGGGSIVFDGSNDYVRFSSSSSINVNTFTWSAFVNGVYSNTPGFFFIGNDIGQSISPYKIFIGVQNNNGIYRLRVNYNNVATVNLGSLINNTLYNLVITYNGSVTNMYVNGESIGSSTAMSGTLNSKTYLYVATTQGIFEFFNGTIHNTLFYNRALSATEVLQNYNAQKGRFGL
jgi:hypothetical protein